MSAEPLDRWRWVRANVVFAVHDRQLAEHGGADGIRDKGAIESALARAANLEAYGNPDIADLAAAYIYGLASSHPFTDGNKRTAWVTGRLFLADNGTRLEFDPFEAVRLMEGVAGGRIAEADLAAWLRSRLSGPHRLPPA